MKKLHVMGMMLLAMLVFTVSPVVAGTLDGAPFKIKLPGKDWILNDATAQDVGMNASLVATLIQTNSTLRSIVIKTEMNGSAAVSYANLLAGIRESLTRPEVSGLTEDRTTFVGINAREFTYEISQNGLVMYSDTMVFISGTNGWTVDCVGPIAQKDAIKKM